MSVHSRLKCPKSPVKTPPWEEQVRLHEAILKERLMKGQARSADSAKSVSNVTHALGNLSIGATEEPEQSLAKKTVNLMKSQRMFKTHVSVSDFKDTDGYTCVEVTGSFR